MKKLLLIDNHDSFTYNLVDLLRKFPIELCVKPAEKIRLEDLEDFSHFLISPGPDVPQAYPQYADILQQYHTSKSILGVCLGHQILCEFFGGQLYNLPQVRHGQNGRLTQSQPSLLFSGLPPQFDIGLYHSWAVSAVDFPAILDVTAHCQAGVVMAMQHRHLPIYGVQFHPESFMTSYGELMLANWLGLSASN